MSGLRRDRALRAISRNFGGCRPPPGDLPFWIARARHAAAVSVLPILKSWDRNRYVRLIYVTHLHEQDFVAQPEDGVSLGHVSPRSVRRVPRPPSRRPRHSDSRGPCLAFPAPRFWLEQVTGRSYSAKCIAGNMCCRRATTRIENAWCF